jgi:hypothetical protein
VIVDLEASDTGRGSEKSRQLRRFSGRHGLDDGGSGKRTQHREKAQPTKRHHTPGLEDRDVSDLTSIAI